MRPDFIIHQRSTGEGLIYVITPTHTRALNWMFAHVQATERRQICAHLTCDRLAEFRSDAAIAAMTLSEPQVSPQPAGGGNTACQ